MLTLVAYQLDFVLLLHSNQTHSCTSPFKNNSSKVHLQLPDPLNPSPANTRSAHMHSQSRTARTLKYAAKEALTLSLTLLAASADPCWRKPISRLQQTKSSAPLSLCFSTARGRTNLELREKFILPEGASQGLAAFRSRGRRSKPGSRNASPTRSSSSASHSGASLPSAPSAPATPTASASSRVRDRVRHKSLVLESLVTPHLKN